jgi:hypothetical protein
MDVPDPEARTDENLERQDQGEPGTIGRRWDRFAVGHEP